MAYFQSKLLILFFILASLPAYSNQELKDISSLIDKEPEKALVQAKAHWQGMDVSENNIPSALLLIKAYVKNKEFESGKELLDELLALAGLKPENFGLLLAQNLIVSRLLKNKDEERLTEKQALLLIKVLNRELKTTEQQHALHVLNREIGYKHYFSAKFDRAEPYFLTSLKYLNKNDSQPYSDLLNTIGVVYAQQAKLAKAAEYMLDSIKTLEDNALPIEPNQYLNLGSLYYGLKDFEKTVDYCQKALSIQTKQDRHTVVMYSNMAAAQIELEQNDEAIINLHKSIDTAGKLGLSSASARNNLGYLYKQMGQFEKALEQLNLSAAELDDIENSDLHGVSFKSRADVYAEMKQYDVALALYDKAYEVFKEKDLKLKRVELYPQMLTILEWKNDHQRAYQILKEFKELNDEITAVESTNQVNKILAGFELEKKEQELSQSELLRVQQQKDIVLLHKTNEFEHRIRNLMIALALVLMVLLVLFYRLWQYRGKANLVLLGKNDHIEKQHEQLTTLNSQLKIQAEIDALTGLNNRRYITQMVAEASAKDRKEQKQWCLMIIDIDDFKEVNDVFGHQRGDQILKQFAACLKNTKRNVDIVARWGGEEFLWLTEISEGYSGPQQCNAFQTKLDKITWFRDSDRKVTCSIGFANFPLFDLNFQDWEAALRLADFGLYQAKKAGKDAWVGFDLLDDSANYNEFKDVNKMMQLEKVKVLKKFES